MIAVYDFLCQATRGILVKMILLTLSLFGTEQRQECMINNELAMSLTNELIIS